MRLTAYRVQSYQTWLHNLHSWVMFPCFSAARLVPKVPRALWSASTLASKHGACALAGHTGRITSLAARRWFFLFGVGLFFVLSLLGYFNEFLATGVLRGTCGRSFRFFARVTRALPTRGTALAAMLAAAFTSRSITPCSAQTDSSCVGCETLAPHLWHSCEVLAGFTDTTQPPFCDT